MSKFKAVQTEYKGYLFRSRLEARWAVFFDALGIRWEYEPEGIVLSDGTHYLPDFYLPDFHCFFEVKRKGLRRTAEGDAAIAKISDGQYNDSWAGIIKIASTKENSVEALLTRETVFSFLNHATKSQNGSSFKIVDTAGNVFLSGENINCNEEIEEDGIKFLKKLRKIELKYDLLFQCPRDNAEYRKVDILSELIELGYTTAFKAISDLETYSIDKKQLLKIGLHSLKNRPLYIFHRGDFRCQLYGNDFSLGNITVLMGPYTTKGSGTIHKAMTYAKGDKRKINLRLCGNAVCYLINDEKKAKATELLSDLGEYIQVGNMDCIWDFIYEIHS